MTRGDDKAVAAAEEAIRRAADTAFSALPQEGERALLQVCRPAFGRSSTFTVFALLATGLVAQTARRTVVGMLAGTAATAVVSFIPHAGSSRRTAGTPTTSGWRRPG